MQLLFSTFGESYTIAKMHAHIQTSPAPLSEGELQTEIRHVLSDGFTGQIQITFLDQRTASLFVQQGVVQNLYIRNHRLPDVNWEELLSRMGTGMLVVESMPARNLMFRKMILEEIRPVQNTPSHTSQLQTMFGLAEHNQNPTLFEIHWQSADAFVLVAGGRIPIQHASLIERSAMHEGPSALERIYAWEETNCSVFIHRGDIRNQAWLELHLNILLEWYSQNILNHYQQLTGIVMVRSILQGLAVLAETRGWQISTHNQQLEDVSLFPNASVAGHEYREMLAGIRSRIEPIIGSSLTRYLMKRSTESTRGVYKLIQETYDLVEDTP